MPADGDPKRAITSLAAAATPTEQRAAVEQLQALAPDLLALRDLGLVAAAISALDRLLGAAQDPALLEAIERAALPLSDAALVERMVQRLGQPHVPPEQRETLGAAVGAPAASSLDAALAAFLATPVDAPAPYRSE